MKKQVFTTRIARMGMNVLTILCGCFFLLTACTENPLKDIKDWKTREMVMKALYETENEKFNELMYQWLEEPEAMDYEFYDLQECTSFHKAMSEDGNLCVFSWDSYEGGIVTKWNNVVCYRNGDKPHSVKKNLWNFLPERNGHSSLAIDDDGTDYGCITLNIHQIRDLNGQPLYLAENHLIDGRWSYSSISAFTIVDDKLKGLPEMFVTNNYNIYDEIDFSYDGKTRYDVVERFLGMQPVYHFNVEKQELLVPVEGNETEWSDRYIRYVFNGSKFIQSDTVCAPNIHPSLQQFKERIQYYRMNEHFIRVDKMNDGTLRYASWHLAANTAAEDVEQMLEPQIILTGGSIDENGEWYVFRNKNYEYRVNALQYGTQTLEIRKDGKVIYTESQDYGKLW